MLAAGCIQPCSVPQAVKIQILSKVTIYFKEVPKYFFLLIPICKISCIFCTVSLAGSQYLDGYGRKAWPYITLMSTSEYLMRKMCSRFLSLWTILMILLKGKDIISLKYPLIYAGQSTLLFNQRLSKRLKRNFLSAKEKKKNVVFSVAVIILNSSTQVRSFFPP